MLSNLSCTITYVRAAVAHAVETGTDYDIEFRIVRPDGSIRWMARKGRAVCDETGRAIRMLGVGMDITERKQAEEQRMRYALHDALTDLPNRVLFMDRLGCAVERAKRHAEYCFAVLFLDLDCFKEVNDNLGHIIGDRLLIAVARRLEACVRTEDTVARLGGDEFVILLDEITDASDAIHVADRIQEALQEPFEVSGHQVFTMASIGITLSTTGYERLEDVLRDADTAMYRAKTLGKARYEVVDAAMHARVLALSQLQADLRGAVERQEFQLQYQPVVSLPNGTIIGVEALLRWQHPQRGLIPPEEFISVAEEMGIIVPLGRWVLQTACAQVNAWRMAGLPQLWVSVNLSARQFKQKDLSSMVASILAETGLTPQCLALEITESSVMDDAEGTIATLQQLKALGVNLSIDDFGTGYSSLHYLKRFPLDTLKIARSFVQDIATGPNDAAIITAIIAMAHSLGLKIIAEGMETWEQLAFLSAHQCDAIQGYLFSHPVSVETLTAILEQGYCFGTEAWNNV